MLRFCEECGRDSTFLLNNDGFCCCDECGLVDEHYVHLVCDPKKDKEVLANGRWEEEETLAFGRFTSDLSSLKGRYKPIFHWNERISQLCCTDPDLPEYAKERIYHEAITGGYGPLEDFTRADVITILKKIKLNHLREKWKKILVELNQDYVLVYPTMDFLETIEHVYNAVEARFYEMKREMMPKSVIRKKNGVVRIQDRHSNLPFNYLFRKICEAFDVYDWHNELPLLRSASKLHNLDDITMVIFRHIGLKFKRTVVIKRPKYNRQRNKKRSIGNK